MKLRLEWLALSLVSSTALAQTVPVSDGAADAKARATEAKMTDEERFQLLHGIMPIAFPGTPPLPRADLKPTAGWIPGVPRLGIPDLYETDASLGVTNPLQLRKGDHSTALPSGLSLAATWSPEIAFRGGVVAGNETRQKGFNILLAGGVNLARDPRNGRNFEYLGEDPLLAGRLAGASIRGIQSQRVVSTIKHFALNDQETLRNTIDARIDEKAFRESDLLAFELAIADGKPGSVMCAYNRVNGDYACGNDFLLNQVLKRDWGYAGWVMSDWGAVHDVGFFAKGLDQQSGAQLDKQVFFDKPLRAEVTAGRVPMERVRESVRRILRSLYAVGADAPLAEGPIDEAAHAVAARGAAAAGIVLLKNDGDILPLTQAKTVAVIGGHADIGVLSGGGSSQVTPKGAVTILPLGGRGVMGAWARQLYMPSSPQRALAAALPGAKVDYDSGYDLAAATAFAKQSDVAIVFATAWSSEGNDFSMTLPEGQDALIAAVAAANPNTIVVLETGNPVKMPWLDKVKAVVEAWYPGQEGGAAIADVLTGKVNPSGRLPITFPADEAQLPRTDIPGWGKPEGSADTVTYAEGAAIGYRWHAAKGTKPLFAFGHGLSYTRFEQSGLQLRGGAQPVATVTVRNIGARAGTDVVQLYLTRRAETDLQRLAGFARVELAPGESRTITIPIEPKLLADWTPEGWRSPAGTYRFAVAPSAAAAGITADIRLPERRLGR
ncbi:beta-glucosidase family protein [Sphingomonas pokkalii]|uniref:Glycosyl hydrolase n=1 Tax=Sphingomonas pokkalii TaxID=2175090 RepID=A0A2U0SH88_9SPHN|nr:glycoside hydrolase family 3 C-terminal domain-containing protein [Sphingomonas pokkalii]PVX30726.1 glycosyl hydrolase [Sphingomonas pokkalii]